MSFPDSHPPFTSRLSTDGSGCWPGFPGNHQDQFMYSDQVPPPKRARNSEYNVSSYGQHIPSTNSRMNPPANPIGSKGTTHIFYKTRMCVKFLDGSCKNGANCTFAHGIEDLREPPPNWQDLVRDGGARNWNDDQRMIHKMKICRKFYNGEECPYGQNCNFLHERPNPNSVSSGDEWPRSNVNDPCKRDSAVISIGTQMVDDKCYDRPDIAKVKNSNSDALIVKPVYWKTKLCSKWEITGQCPFGERCHFAHGLSELHVPSFPVEADVSTIQIMPSSAPAIDPSPGIDVGAQIKVVSENKNFSGWKSKRKINKIYGDWLDDLTPHLASPKEVEDW